jgi:UDP-N-acetylmuramyl pentapeptide phosphotransferase/UDP-N-acetylglucosamine-1-phosphate transferase
MALVYLSTGGLILCLAWLTLFPLQRCLDRWQAIDIPNERSSHSRPTTRGGGVIIVVLTLGSLLALSLLWPALSLGAALIYALGAALIAAVSWLDDLRSLSSRVRFGVHSVGALIALAGFGYWSRVTLPLIGELPLGWLGLPLTFFWIVGLTNAYNFMDGIDGIAGSQAVVGGLAWAAIGAAIGQPLVAALGTLVAASSLGFLGHNWSPARIFMGDVGSAFLGYSFALLPLIAAAPRDAGYATQTPLAGLLVVWPFVFDTALTIVRRWRNGENIFAAHRSHLYQRLIIAGYSHRAVTLLYTAMAASGAIFAYLFVTTSGLIDWLVVAGVMLGAAGLHVFVARQERRRTDMKAIG